MGDHGRLGAHAPGAIMFYTAGRCTTLTTDVGIDDEKRGNRNGSVVFQIWADGRKVADSGVSPGTQGLGPTNGTSGVP